MPVFLTLRNTTIGFAKGAYNQAVAPGITRLLHAHETMKPTQLLGNILTESLKSEFTVAYEML